jgi:hypothetical protein
MSSIFCCSNLRGYKNKTLSHESRFSAFKSWASFPKESSITASDILPADVTYAIQLVRQVNFGPIETKRYFVKLESDDFAEVDEKWLIDANFEKLNS